MSQPKLPPDLSAEIAYLGFVASCYQPVSMFKPDKRKLPNIPNEDDPWQVFLRRPGEVGISTVAYGSTLREAVEAALYLRPGLTAAMIRLGDALEGLTGDLQCR